MKTEAARIVGTITAAVTAVIALLVSYGFDITNDQQTAILSIVAVIAPLVAGLVIRGQVWSTEHVQDVTHRAAETGMVPFEVSEP